MDAAEQLRTAAGEPIADETMGLLSRLFAELDEIGGGNLFGAFDDELTLTPTLDLAAILVAEGIALPPTGPFMSVRPRNG